MAPFIISCSLLGLVGLAANWLARSRAVKPEMARKMVHVALGLLIAFTSYFASEAWTGMFIGLVLSAVIVAKLLGMFVSLRKVGRQSHGEIYFLLGAIIALLLSETQSAFVVGILVLSLSDSIAALIGEKFGLHKYQVFGEFKSLEGSLTFWLTASLITLVYVIAGPESIINDWLLVAILPIVLTFTEAVSPRGLDNLTIPILATLTINLI
jgi:phytol kinase